MQRDDVGDFEQRLHGWHGAGVAERQFHFDVVKHDLHAQGLGQDADLGADVAVADDAQRFAAGFAGTGGGLDPFAAMSRGVARRNAAHQQNDFGQHQLGHAAGVGKRSVEDGDAAVLRRRQVHLVGADAEASDGDEVARGFEHVVRQLRGRADTHDISVANGVDELRLGQGFLVDFDIGIAVRAESVHRAGVNAFEQNDFHFVFGKGCLCHE